MSLLSSVAASTSAKAETNYLGGYTPLESRLYDFTIDLAFLNLADSGACCLNIHMTSDEGKKLKQQFYISSGNDKGNRNYFIDKNGEEAHLPGFNQANALCLLTAGKEVLSCATENKVVSLYDFAERQEVPTKVEMLTELLGKKITAGVLKQTVNKSEKDPKTKKYVATAETKVENEVDKFFRHRDGLTVPEIRAGITTPDFKTDWAEKWTGVIKDKTKAVVGIKAGIQAGAPAAAMPSGAAAPQLLFA